MPIWIKWNKNNYLFEDEISRIGKSSLLKYKNSSLALSNKEVDIMNTSAPVKISDYISTKLVRNSSVTPTHKQWASQNKSESDSIELKQFQENKTPNLDTLTSAARIAQKIQELSQENYKIIEEITENKRSSFSGKCKLILLRV